MIKKLINKILIKLNKNIIIFKKFIDENFNKKFQ